MKTYTPSTAVKALVEYAVENQGRDRQVADTARGALRRAVLAEMLRHGDFSTHAELMEKVTAWCDAAIADHLTKTEA